MKLSEAEQKDERTLKLQTAARQRNIIEVGLLHVCRIHLEARISSPRWTVSERFWSLSMHLFRQLVLALRLITSARLSTLISIEG
jgi:hypothetical protein